MSNVTNYYHSSQFQSLCSTKSFSETLLDLPYFIPIYEKATLGFRIYKIWQILKRFAGTFRQAQTLKLGRIMTKSAFSSYFTKKKISFKLSIKVLIKFVKEI